jgi:hypothetical protein
MHGDDWYVFSKCCPNQPIERANLDKPENENEVSDREGVVSISCIQPFRKMILDRV